MDIIDFLLLIVDVISTFYDVGSYIKSRENRRERKEAKDLGQKPPARSRWTIALYILTPVIIVLTAYLVWRKFVR